MIYLRKQFEADLKNLTEGGSVSLLGKWLPSVNASNQETVYQAKKVARAFGMNDAAYRKALTALRAKIHIIENHLREKVITSIMNSSPLKRCSNTKWLSGGTTGKDIKLFSPKQVLEMQSSMQIMWHPMNWLNLI